MKKILFMITCLFAVLCATIVVQASPTAPVWSAQGVIDTSIPVVQYGPGTNIQTTATLAGVPSYTPKIAGTACTPYGSVFRYYKTRPTLPGRGVIEFYIQNCI